MDWVIRHDAVLLLFNFSHRLPSSTDRRIEWVKQCNQVFDSPRIAGTDTLLLSPSLSFYFIAIINQYIVKSDECEEDIHITILNSFLQSLPDINRSSVIPCLNA
jgi:hypothetical protein